jgi:hypothetical protein
LNQGIRYAQPEEQEHYSCSGDDDGWVSYWGDRVVHWDRGQPELNLPDLPDLPLPYEEVEELPW